MINQIKTYILVGVSFLAASLVYVFWRRGEKLAKIQAELFQEKANQEVVRYEEKAKQARRDYNAKRNEYNELVRKFKQRASVRRSSK